MMCPFMQLEDNTEIVHSEWLADEKVKVYIEQPVIGGFKSATYYLPRYEWCAIEGFTKTEIDKYQEILESTAHLIIRFAKGGGFENAERIEKIIKDHENSPTTAYDSVEVMFNDFGIMLEDDDV